MFETSLFESLEWFTPITAHLDWSDLASLVIITLLTAILIWDRRLVIKLG